MVVTLGQQYNVGEKPTVILYTYINRHAGTPDKHQKQNRNHVVHHHTWYNKIIYCYIGYKYKASTWYLNGLPNGIIVTLGQQYNVGEKPTVILYTCINRHAEPSNITNLRHCNT